MPATSSVSPTGNANIDGLLSGTKWAVTSLTYSVPTGASFYGASYGSGEPTNNFEAFTATQLVAVRKALAAYASVSNLTFTEVTETSTTHGALRYAESDTVGTAWGYYPSVAEAGGDMWFNNSNNYYDNPVVGNYAYLTILHETGHALGLKHPHAASGSFGAEPSDRDSLEYTVMSYRSYIGASTTTGYTNGSFSFPQTLMMLDIAALQEMYGANYNTNAGDFVYKWSATTGEMTINGVGQGAPGGNKIFMTVWDGAGNDTYDFSNYTTNLKVDLAPGGWTTVSTTQLANLGSSKLAVGNIANALLYKGNTASLIENAIGGGGADNIAGNSTNNKLTGNGGNDYLDGREGSDTAVYSGRAAEYLVVDNGNGTWSITDLRTGATDGVDTVTNIEYLQFTDANVALGATTTPPPPTSSNLAPNANNDVASLLEDTSINMNVLANDSDPEGATLSFSGLPTASNGTVTINADGTLRYTPKANFFGADTISYAVTDGSLTDAATVAVTVTNVNDAPIAANDAYSTARGTRLTVSGKGVLANDTDADGNALTTTLVSSTKNGSLTANSNGTFTYRPRFGFVGTDSFTYRVSDGTTTSGTATVTITVGQPAAGQANASWGAAAGAPEKGLDQIPAPVGEDWLRGFLPDPAPFGVGGWGRDHAQGADSAASLGSELTPACGGVDYHGPQSDVSSWAHDQMIGMLFANA